MALDHVYVLEDLQDPVVVQLNYFSVLGVKRVPAPTGCAGAQKGKEADEDAE